MQVEELAPGLWYWTGYHEEWKQDVGCASLHTADGLVLIDPLVPPEDRDGFLKALDRDVKRAGGVVHVLVTVYYHARSAGELVERYRGRLWASTRARATITRRAGEPTDTFRPGDALPGGIEAIASGDGTGEVVYRLPDQQALVFGDVVLGSDDGGVRLCPASWLSASTSLDRVREHLRPLLDRPIERIVVSHGNPVRSGGRAALERALRP